MRRLQSTAGLIASLVFAVCLSCSTPTHASNEYGALRVEGALTLDARTPEFQFTLFEVTPGAQVTFINLEVDDTLILRASDAIRIDGTLVILPANTLWLEAPQIHFGEYAILDMSGGAFALAGSGIGVPSEAIRVSGRGGAMSLEGTLSLAGPGEIRAGATESLTSGAIGIQQGGDITLQAPVPEADTYAMVLAGLVLVGLAARRKQARAVPEARRALHGRRTDGAHPHDRLQPRPTGPAPSRPPGQSALLRHDRAIPAHP